MRYIASVSFGKDSLAMLIVLIARHEPLDEVVFYDTGMEFQAIYDTRDVAVKELLEPNNIKFTQLKPSMPFMDKMLNYEHKTRKGGQKKGYGWCGGMCRWGTTEKLRAIDKYCEGAHQYIGIALDETKRLQRLNGTNKSAPLAKYGKNKKKALELCYFIGFHWEQDGIRLYDVLDRVSCWCCRNKNLKELRNYKRLLPEYYDRLVKLENKIGEPMKKPYKLEERFKEMEK